ncbi:MAG TPA: sigma 54-interacting transcriptional regulator [Polyangiales bacterium]|nr:sigma 54-interacting transcriptional regulator [Polyangiales bacterium]
MKQGVKSAPAERIIARAFAELAGSALVLDSELRVVLATREAEALVGAPIKPGTPAVKVLCANSPKRELAEALLAGRSISTLIQHRDVAGKERALRVRALALRDAGQISGYVLWLDGSVATSGEAVQFHGMWSRNLEMKEAFRIVQRVAAEDITVLVRGETGTGKELVASALHAESPRSDGPFRAINCAALPAALLESELFGHVRGAFTGAIRDKQGHFQLAHRGTLFLDEIGELPLELQAKLLRVLETRSVLPVGAVNATPVDVRIVSATHRALRKEVEAGRFRADLMYRLRVVTIYLPRLSERREDIALLCEKLIGELNRSKRRKIERVAPHALSVLESYDWPGNIRELQNVLLYAYAIGDGPVLQASDLPLELMELDASSLRPERERIEGDEAQKLRAALARTRGNKLEAAKMLGMSRVTLWRRLRALGLAE